MTNRVTSGATAATRATPGGPRGRAGATSPRLRVGLATLVISGACGAAACWVGLPSASATDDLSGEQILRRVDREHRARDERGVVDMVLITEDRRQQRRTMEILFKEGPGEDDKHLLRFLDPPTIRGTALLTLEASGRSDDQWVYLPALRRTRKIASSARNDRFAQTDFTYEDLRTEDFEVHGYERRPDVTFEGVACFQVVATPKTSDDSGYSRRVVTVEKARLLTLRVEFFDKRDRHQKTLLNRDYVREGGLWRPRQAMMEDHQRGSRTVWRFTERQINPGLPDATFTVGTLERGL